VLLVSRLQPLIASVRRHCRVGTGSCRPSCTGRSAGLFSRPPFLGPVVAIGAISEASMRSTSGRRNFRLQEASTVQLMILWNRSSSVGGKRAALIGLQCPAPPLGCLAGRCRR
jgi:hypothetical protein